MFMGKDIFDTVNNYVKSGDYARAIFEIKRALSLDRTNLALKAKLAELYGISGDISNAIIVYSELAREYANKGFLIQAIAANKKIMELDPEHQDTQKHLAKLYAQKAKNVLRDIAPKEEGSTVEELTEVVTEKSAEVPIELPTFPLFSDVSQSEFIEIIKRLKTRSFKAQSMIFKEGDKGDSIFLVASGKVNIYKRDASGRQVFLRAINEGDFFGEFSYFANSKRNVSAISAEDSQLLELTRDEIDRMLEEFSGFKTALIEFYKKRVLDTILGVTPIFRELPFNEREKFLPKFELIIIPKDEDIVKEGDLGDSMFVIVSGLVEVWTKRAGKRIVLATLKEGDFFGEIALITGEPRTATVTALKETRLMKLRKADFDDIASTFPKVREIAKGILDKRLEATITTVISMEDRGLT